MHSLGGRDQVWEVLKGGGGTERERERERERLRFFKNSLHKRMWIFVWEGISVPT